MTSKTRPPHTNESSITARHDYGQEPERIVVLVYLVVPSGSDLRTSPGLRPSFGSINCEHVGVCYRLSCVWSCWSDGRILNLECTIGNGVSVHDVNLAQIVWKCAFLPERRQVCGGRCVSLDLKNSVGRRSRRRPQSVPIRNMGSPSRRSCRR